MWVLFALTLTLTSCSETANGADEEVTESSSQTAILSEGELSYRSGSSKITYTGKVGTAWSAQITTGDDFVSFSSINDTSEKSGSVISSASNTLYFYYDRNSTAFDRKAVIEFTFEGSETIELAFSQLCELSSYNPYNSTTGEPRWYEIPEMDDDDRYLYVVHSTTVDGVEVRNFSLGFDTKNYAAAWVAYPYHSMYDGDVGRNEEWTYDPLIPTAYQANLSGSYSGSYDRGHQIASNDRQATVDMNEQTFYYSNMTPQLDDLNQQKWASAETVVRNQVCSDTLYVVTGADFTTTIGTTSDKSGKACPIPGAYFKVMLRTRDGNTGKAIGECSADELKAIGYWFEHEKYTSIPSPVSVKEIEEKTGFTFFPGVPDEVKAECKSSDWYSM